MPETSPHTDASDAPEKRDIYGLYDMSDTADAADMYEAPEAFDVFDPGILPDAAEAASTDFTDFTDASDADETPEILSRVDSLMMRRRGVVSPLSPTEPSLMSEPDPAPETVQAVEEITPETAPEDDPAAWAAPPDVGLLEQSFLPALTEDASPISAPPEQPLTEDDDLPILTDVILIDAASADTTQPPLPDHQEEAFGEAAEEVPTVRAIDIAADSSGDIDEAYPASPTGEMPADEAAADLAGDITRLCRERLASELPALLENLLNAAEKELRAGIAAIVDDALQEAMTRHQYPTLTPHAPEDGDEAE